jgi:hypothetical protein
VKLADSHPGGKSPTLIERIRAKADSEYTDWATNDDLSEAEADVLYYRVEGMCAALGILCSTTEELQWDSVVARQKDMERRGTQHG